MLWIERDDRLQDVAQFGLGFALMVAYWPGIAGVATTPRWDIGVLIAMALWFSPRIEMQAVHWVGLTLVAWLAFNAVPPDGVDAVLKLLLIAAAFAFGSSQRDIRPFVAGAAVGLSLSSVIAVAQWFGWSGIESYHAPAGLFYNADRMAEVAAVVLAAVLALRMTWAIPGLIPALMLPQARGALVAALAAAGIVAWSRSGLWHRLAMMLGVIVVAALFASRGLDGITERLALWLDTVNALSWGGHGFGSFATTFPQYANAFDIAQSRPEHPHNEWLSLAYEGGIVAVVLAVAFAVVLARQYGSELRLVLVTLGILSLFAMPFHDPATVLFGAVCAGAVAAGRRDVGNPAIARGNPLRPRMAARAVWPSRA